MTGKILTLTGASGVGKTTIAGEILKRMPNAQMGTSTTTRARRDSDLPGEYDYVSQQKFFEMVKENLFLWWVSNFGNSYGTAEEILESLKQNPDKLLLMQLVPGSIELVKAEARKRGIQVISLYILSPPENILRERLNKRGDSPEEIEKRLQECKDWDTRARRDKHLYEGFVHNSGIVEEALYSVFTHLAARGMDID